MRMQARGDDMNTRSRHRDTSPRRGRPLARYVPSIVLAIALLASPLAIGGVHAGVAAGIAAGSCFGLWWAVATDTTGAGKTGLVAVSIPTIGFAVMALACLVQLIPLPTGVYRLVQPAGFEAWQQNWQVVFGRDPDPGWHLLSMDPRATSEQALRWLALAATTALAGWVIADRRQRRRWLGLVLVGGLVVAAVGFAQHFSGTDRILWFYEADVGARSISPFVSTNHSAAYYGLLTVVGMVYSVDHLRNSPAKAALGTAAAVLFLVLTAAENSAGVAGAVAAGVLVLSVAVLRRVWMRSGRSRARRAGLGVMVVLFVAAVAAMFVPPQFITGGEDAPELEETSLEVRLEMTGAALRAVGDHPVAGTGAGSTERTLGRYVDWTRLRGQTIRTIENEPVEWAMTLGVIVAAIMAVLAAMVIARTAPHLWRRRGRRGAVAAVALVVFMGVVSLFHFPFHTLGVALVGAVAVEACLNRRRDALFVTASSRGAVLFVLGLSVAVAGLVVARATVLTPGAEQDLQVDDRQRVQRALQMYPTDARLMSALSLQAREDDENDHALQLAERAFELRGHPQQQILLANSLAVAGEPREAAELYAGLLDPQRRTPYLAANLPERIRNDLPDAELRAAAVADASAERLQQFFDHLREQEHQIAAIEVALELIEHRPGRPVPHLELIASYRATDQPMLAEMYARSLVDRNLEGPDGERPAGLRQLLDIFVAQDRVDEARNMAGRAFDAGYAGERLARTVVDLMPDNPAQIRDDHRALYDEAVAIGCEPPYSEHERGTCWRGRAVLAEADGDIGTARSLLRSIERTEDDPRPLGALLTRHQRCRELAAVVRRHEDERHHSHLERQLEQCHDYYQLD